ncbi:MAG TPA: hypothetical protein VM555_06950 [Tahibacter sp.]|jgi:hypothetical protein|uniref:Plastocyanin n=1 Tax=Tahibacter soli TaxID=2983605 RepID=A0A9X3YHF7_9GAMM|nr:hypothetical protein [Tahibacter soli]MDC8012322.1 hypothetical protein [Tahibacter soli]HVJ62435.1 hypothetical protein [Tahibacter sp.]
MHAFHARSLLRPFAALAFAFAVAPAVHAGGNSFTVTNNGTGAWVLDGVENPPLTLTRGQSYTFQLQGVSAIHPFNINTINITGNGNRYNSGVTNNGATGNTAITFVVPNDAPDSLHYNCANHGLMNGPITVVNGVVDAIFADDFEV